jgi:hypothetical protein
MARFDAVAGFMTGYQQSHGAIAMSARSHGAGVIAETAANQPSGFAEKRTEEIACPCLPRRGYSGVCSGCPFRRR